MVNPLNIGDRIIDRWEIRDIKQGGMGLIYIVCDHKSQESMAAKTFLPELLELNPAIADRFRKEAAAWVNLDKHQNVTQAYMIHEIRGNPFLFLEYVPGGNLSQLINDLRGSENLPKILGFALNICDGMIHITSKGIKAHRDLKPENCLITEYGTLKVTDFGLASLVDAGIAVNSAVDEWVRRKRDVYRQSLSVTKTGSAFGTAAYMPPEQFDDSKHVDVRADIYAFGCILFQMLTGSEPFEAHAWREYERLHKEQPVPSLPAHLSMFNAVMSKCLAKKPTQRFDDFEALGEELEKLYLHLTGEAFFRAYRELDYDRLEDMEIEETESGGKIVSFKGGPPPNVEKLFFLSAEDWANKAVSLRRLGKNAEALECHQRALALEPDMVEVWINMAATLMHMNRLDEALEATGRAVALDAKDARAWCNRGVVLNELKRYAEAITCFNRSIKLNPEIVEAWSGKGVAISEVVSFREAIHCYDKALQLRPEDLEIQLYKAKALFHLQRFEEAISCLEHVLDLNPRNIDAWLDMADCYADLGRDEEEEECCDKVMQITPTSAIAWAKKGTLLSRRERFEESLDYFDRALELDPNIADAWYNKAHALDSLGRHADALRHIDQALRVEPFLRDAWELKGRLLLQENRLEYALACFERETELYPDHLYAWANKGVALGKLGRPQEALSCYDHVLSLDPSLGDIWFNKAVELINATGHYDKAITCFEEALRLGKAEAGEAIAECRRRLRK